MIKDPELRVYAVWVPILPSDVSFTVPRATTKLPDERVTHYWDSQSELVKSYGPVLKLEENQPAWDLYFVYGRNAEWKNEPPMPDYWMHQLDLDPERTLDGRKLATEIEKLIQAK